MGDLIERKDALAKLIALRKDNAEYSCENDIMRGKDIAYENAMDIIARMPAVNRWIPCEDELPERDTNVLIYYPAWQDAPVQTAHIMSDGSCWEFSDGEFYPSMKDITHWMPLPPLPEPPEVTQDDNG